MNSAFTIAAVEREVGLSKDVLRVWERRYGFPTPTRDGRGERLYPPEQVQRLRLVRRLMDQGFRPGYLLAASMEQLESLAAQARAAGSGGSAAEAAGELDPLLVALRAHDAVGLQQALQHRLAQSGLARFVQDTMSPTAIRVGDEWAHGQLAVFEEHLFTEVAGRVLRQAIGAVPPGHEPVVVLTTAPDEPHGLGLLMAEAMMCLRGARCISLGLQVPLSDIAQAARAYRADVVALSFSAAFAARRIPPLLEQLRGLLPATTELWAGGAALARLAAPAGVRLLAALDDASAAVDAWREGSANRSA